MFRALVGGLCVCSAMAVGLMAGCASSERANVQFSYVVEPEPGKGLPPGMKTVSIQPASVGPTTDQKWSDLSATVMQNLVNESRNRFGTEVTVSDRRDTQVTFNEADLKAAGMSTAKGGSGGQLLAAQGVIVSNINVKVEQSVGKQRTITGIDLGAFGGHHAGGGRAAVETGEVETVKRTMTVQSDFRLLDTANNKVWEQYETTQRGTEETKASPLFGSSKTEKELTPQDQIIGTLVERACREFLSKIMPVRVDVEAEVAASGNADCQAGVRALRADQFDEAVNSFKAALAANPNDDKAAFGAGVACEASGQYTEALKFYNRAVGLVNNRDYIEARDRMKSFSDRVRKGAKG